MCYHTLARHCAVHSFLLLERTFIDFVIFPVHQNYSRWGNPQLPYKMVISRIFAIVYYFNPNPPDFSHSSLLEIRH